MGSWWPEDDSKHGNIKRFRESGKERGVGIGPDAPEMQDIQTDAWQEGGHECLEVEGGPDRSLQL